MPKRKQVTEFLPAERFLQGNKGEAAAHYVFPFTRYTPKYGTLGVRMELEVKRSYLTGMYIWFTQTVDPNITGGAFRIPFMNRVQDISTFGGDDGNPLVVNDRRLWNPFMNLWKVEFCKEHRQMIYCLHPPKQSTSLHVSTFISTPSTWFE